MGRVALAQAWRLLAGHPAQRPLLPERRRAVGQGCRQGDQARIRAHAAHQVQYFRYARHDRRRLHRLRQQFHIRQSAHIPEHTVPGGPLRPAALAGPAGQRPGLPVEQLQIYRHVPAVRQGRRDETRGQPPSQGGQPAARNTVAHELCGHRPCVRLRLQRVLLQGPRGHSRQDQGRRPAHAPHDTVGVRGLGQGQQIYEDEQRHVPASEERDLLHPAAQAERLGGCPGSCRTSARS